MMATTGISTSGKVGKRYFVTLSFYGTGMVAEWKPKPPTQKHFDERCWRDYVRIRNRLVRKVEDATGLKMLVVDLA